MAYKSFPQIKVELDFNQMFKSKGYLSSIAEKAKINIDTLNSDTVHMYYKVLGHAFKDKIIKNLFAFEMEGGDLYKLNPTKYLSLTSDEFCKGNRPKKFKELIDNIRNISCHFVHELNALQISDDYCKRFILEAFTMASYASHYNLELESKLISINKNVKELEPYKFLTQIEKEEIMNNIVNNDTAHMLFLKKRFYSTIYSNNDRELSDGKMAIKTYIDNNLNTIEKLNNWILFNDVTDDLDLFLNPQGLNGHYHQILTITKGQYLTLNGMLFVLNMCMYKDEAKLLMSKIKGFKLQHDGEMRSKSDIFLFFSKKFKSQDVSSEESSLIKFRDIIGYLDKYPMDWNKQVEEKNSMFNDIKNDIERKEIKRYYPELALNDEFITYAQEYHFDKSQKKTNDLYLKLCTNHNDYLKAYIAIMNDSNKISKINFKEFKFGSFKLFALKKVATAYFPEWNIREIAKINFKRWENEKYEKELFQNEKISKLRKRISTDTIYQSNGRNDDKFILWAIRFLAEVDYFGANAQFCMYKNYYSENETAMVQTEKTKLSKKQMDKLHYHDGKLIHFKSFKNHLNDFPYWSTPFVIRNNSILIKIDGVKNTINIQEQLLKNLTEHALQLLAKQQPLNGDQIISDYISYKYQKRNESIQNLDNSLTTTAKTELKRIIPRRLLNKFNAPNIPSNIKEYNSLEHILTKADEQEQRFENLKKNAENNDNTELFLNKNKGKNFKLTFINKVCHLMYFRNIILNKRNESKDNKVHKAWHITRDEFNNYSKWMYAFGEVSTKLYKKNLAELFNSKGFFENKEFNEVFKNSNSLEEMYNLLKVNYSEWLKSAPLQRKTNNYTIESYGAILADNEKTVAFINVKDFKNYCIEHNAEFLDNTAGKWLYSSLEKNSNFLNSLYYSTQNSEKEQLDFIYQIKETKHKDCLLYEIAKFYYTNHTGLNWEQIRDKSVRNLLNQPILFQQKDAKNQHYTIEVPFKQAERFLKIKRYYDKTNDDWNLLVKLPDYIEKVASETSKKDVTEIHNNLVKNRILNMDALQKINNHVIRNKAVFTQIILNLEQYYIWKNKITIDPISSFHNRIDIAQISELMKIINLIGGKKERNIALHFNLPSHSSYKTVIKKIEEEFLKQEEIDANSFETCSPPLKEILQIFLDKVHDDLHTRPHNKASEEEKKKLLQDKEAKYFAYISKFKL